MFLYNAPYIVLLLTASVITFILGFYTWKHREVAGARAFIFLMIAVTYWLVLEAIWMGVTTPEAKLFWTQLKYLGIVSVPVAWLAFASQYTKSMVWLRGKRWVLLGIFPVVTVLLFWTNSAHGLMWSDYYYYLHGKLLLPEITYGPWFWVHTVFSYSCIFLGSVLMLKMAFLSYKQYQLPSILLLSGVLLPWIGNAVFLSGLSPLPNLDLTPLVFSISSILLAVGIFHYRLLDILPLARKKVIAEISEGIMVLDPDCHIVDINSAACKLLHLEKSQTIGTTITKIYPSCKDKFQDYCKAPQKSGPKTWEVDKFDRHLEISIAPLSDWQNRTTAHLLTILDITKQKNIQNALRESEAKYRALVEKSHEGLVIASGKNPSLVFVNKAASDMLGYSVEELLSLNASDIKSLVYPDDREMFVKRFLDRLAGKSVPSRYEFRIIRKDGTIRWVVVSATLIEYKSNPAIHAIFMDITREKALEKQLIHAQKMEGLGQIAGGIAHDFNNVLATISGATQMLGLHDEDIEQEKYLQMINSSVERAQSITGRLKNFFRPENPQFQPVSVMALFKEIQEIAIYTLPKNIEIEISEFEGKDLVYGDKRQLQQVLLNLCINAADAMPEGGNIRFRLTDQPDKPLQSYSSTEDENYLYLLVEDTGIGIAPEDRDRIFEPFFTTKEPGKGTGLGLAIAFGIIQRHKGWIDVQSTPGHGTRFTIGIPRTDRKLLDQTPKNTENLPGGNAEHILVVDDEERIRQLLKETLIRKNYQVTLAENGQDALEKYQKASEAIDIVVTDLDMPKMNGKAFVEHLHSIDPAIKIIAITGYVTPEKREELSTLGIKSIVEKPFDFNDILQELASSQQTGVT